MSDDSTVTPGYKHPAFYLTALATLIAAWFASGAGPESGVVAQGIGVVSASLLAAGYASWRQFTKGADGKPAYKTTEFWGCVLAALVGGAMASGYFGGESLKVLGMVGTVLAALGYKFRADLPPKAL